MKINTLKKSIFLTTILCLITSVAEAKGVGLKQVPALVTSTYIFAVIFMGDAILLAAVILASLGRLIALARVIFQLISPSNH